MSDQSEGQAQEPGSDAQTEAPATEAPATEVNTGGGDATVNQTPDGGESPADESPAPEGGEGGGASE